MMLVRTAFKILLRLRHPSRKGTRLIEEIARRSGQTAPARWNDWEEMLQRYVQSDGKVKYGAWRHEAKKLEELIASVGRQAPSTNCSREDQLAYWINLYNAATVSLMLRHYPVQSIRDIKTASRIPFFGSIFDRHFIPVAGMKLSLNDIEHRILRRLKEPRIHFAINCASESCPALSREAYNSRKLESQLQSGTLQFLSDPAHNVIDKEHTELSAIFGWFLDDFGGEEGLREKMKSWTGKEELPKHIQFKKYNWKINEARDDRKVD